MALARLEMKQRASARIERSNRAEESCGFPLKDVQSPGLLIVRWLRVLAMRIEAGGRARPGLTTRISAQCAPMLRLQFRGFTKADS